MTRRIVAAVAAVFMLAACGGGGGGRSNITIEGPRLGDITPNSVLISDMLVSGQGVSERVSDIYCTPSLSQCRATVQGRVYTFTPEDDSGVSGAIYMTLGEWDDLRAGAIYAQFEGLQFRYAVVGGRLYANSLPLQGSATWTGDMVGLDSNNRVVRGGAALTIADFTNPRVNVLLTPQSRQAMVWNGLPVLNGGFSQKRSASDYIKGEFYGRQAEEAGGVFERNGIVGAFGATR